MRILILGGTAFIGPHVVRELAAKGHDVTIFHRGQHEPPLPPQVRHVHGDFADFASHADALRRLEPEVVLDMVPFRAEDAQRVLAFAGVARRAVVLSSCDVYLAYGRLVRTEPGEPLPVPLTEDSPLRTKPSLGGENYNKPAVEKIAASDPRLPCTILRLPATHGPGDVIHRLYKYARRMADDRPAVLIDRDLKDWQWKRGYVVDVAHAVALAAANDRAAGRVYNVADLKCYTEYEWVKRIAAAMSYRGRILTAPGELLPEPLRGDIDVRQHICVDTSRIRSELGYTEITPEDRALRETVEWELANPPAKDETRDGYAMEDAAMAHAG